MRQSASQRAGYIAVHVGPNNRVLRCV